MGYNLVYSLFEDLFNIYVNIKFGLCCHFPFSCIIINVNQWHTETRVKYKLFLTVVHGDKRMLIKQARVCADFIVKPRNCVFVG